MGTTNNQMVLVSKQANFGFVSIKHTVKCKTNAWKIGKRGRRVGGTIGVWQCVTVMTITYLWVEGS